ncbi:MAG: NTPase [Candidatus Bathyarchaeota archaeon]|nr:MAG: NTPase [Candidatus Bathyarchaeota archaeon]
MTDKLKRVVLLTGRSGVGKTSLLLNVLDILKAKGYKIGGMVSREAREHGVRVGFEIVDLGTGRKGWLAHTKQSTGPRVGKYRVNLSDLDTIGTRSIVNAIENADIIVVDEIGPMEMFSSGFKEAVMKTLKSTRMMIGTLHYRVRDPLINALKADEDTEILEITPENRRGLHTVLIDRVLQFMQRQP